jgi:hypothetical protein
LHLQDCAGMALQEPRVLVLLCWAVLR